MFFSLTKLEDALLVEEDVKMTSEAISWITG